MPYKDGIFVMPGIDEQIGPALQTLTNNIGGIIDPKFAVRQALNKALDEDFDGKLHQKLIDMGPKLLEQTYGKKTAKRYGKGEISNEEQERRLLNEGIKNLTPEDKAEYLAGKLNIRDAIARSTAKANARTANVGANVQEGTQNAQIESIESGARMATSQANVQVGTEDDQVKSYHAKAIGIIQEGKDIEAAVAAFPELSNINMGGLMSRIASGKSTPQDSQALLRLPEAAQQAIRQGASNLNGFAMESLRFSHDKTLQNMREAGRGTQLAYASQLNMLGDNYRQQYQVMDKNIEEWKKTNPLIASALMAKSKGEVMTPHLQAVYNEYEGLTTRRDALVPQIEDINTRFRESIGIVQPTVEEARTLPPGFKPRDTVPTDGPVQAAYDFLLSQPNDVERRRQFEEFSKTNPEEAKQLAPFVGYDTPVAKKRGGITTGPTQSMSDVGKSRREGLAKGIGSAAKGVGTFLSGTGKKWTPATGGDRSSYDKDVKAITGDSSVVGKPLGKNDLDDKKKALLATVGGGAAVGSMSIDQKLKIWDKTGKNYFSPKEIDKLTYGDLRRALGDVEPEFPSAKPRTPRKEATFNAVEEAGISYHENRAYGEDEMPTPNKQRIEKLLGNLKKKRFTPAQEKILLNALKRIRL